MADIRVGDIGTDFVIAVVDETGDVVDVSSASELKIYLKLPDDTVLTKDAELDSDGTDGLIKYTTVADDLSIQGAWEIQAKITIGSTVFGTSRCNFTVHANLY